MGDASSHAPRRLPRGRVTGRFRPPGSKSLAIRALWCAGLARGSTRIAGLSMADDVRATIALLRAARIEVRELAPAAVAVRGRPPGPERGPAPELAVDAGESGTLARLSSAILGLCAPAGRPVRVEVSGTMRRRSSAALFEALERAGVGVEFAPEAPPGGWPVELRPVGPPPVCTLERPSSSQEASALLVALSAWPGESTLEVRGPIPSRPYLDMTSGVLARFGARVESEASGDIESGRDVERFLASSDVERFLASSDAERFLANSDAERFLVRGPLVAPDEPITVEPDASAAAVALAAACLSGGELEVQGIGAASLQGDARIVAHLAAFGCDAHASADSLRARGAPRHGAELDLRGEPDLAPVLAAVAAAAALDGHASRLAGLETLEGKESARITVLAEGLRRIGLHAAHDGAELVIAPGARATASGDEPLVLDPRADHRMAFAFALLGLRCERVLVATPACVSKSWPGFWEELGALFV